MSTLPIFPASEDTFQILKNEKRPIVVYGMGNGADKLLERFAEYGIQAADFFASDGFVRGHSFHGKRVLSFSEVKEKYNEFRIVLSFASNKSDVIEMLYDMNERYGLIMPDLPVAGSGTFNAAFYNENYTDILKAYSLLEDGVSQNLFADTIQYKLTGNIEYLKNGTCSSAECYDLFSREKMHNFIDAGAYNGDTVREVLGIFPNVTHIIAIEPDRRNYRKLVSYVSDNLPEHTVTPIRAAVSSFNGDGAFFGSGNRNSAAVNASHEYKEENVPYLTIDTIAENMAVHHIKYDVEGAESEALRGSMKTIMRDRPYLTVSAYHRNEDIFLLPNTLAEQLNDYAFYYRRTPCLPAWELRLICVPREKQRKGN